MGQRALACRPPLENVDLSRHHEKQAVSGVALTEQLGTWRERPRFENLRDRRHLGIGQEAADLGRLECGDVFLAHS